MSPIFQKRRQVRPCKLSPDIGYMCFVQSARTHSCIYLTKHLANTNILFEQQHRFREKRSCETQLVMLVDEIAKNMQMGKQTDLILLDFSKAFDKLHTINCFQNYTLMEFGAKH